MADFNKAFGTCTGPLSFPMTDEDARDLEKKLESGEYSPFRLQKADAFEGLFEGERSDISIITDASIDKEGDVVDAETIDFKTFEKNGSVVAFNHNYNIPPIGKALWFKKCTGNVHKAKTQYTSRPDTHPKDAVWFPDSIFHMIKAKTLNGKSLGGAVKWGQPTQEDADRLGFDLNKANRISKKAIVFEYSVCPIAMNNNAIVEAISKSAFTIPEDILSTDFPEVYLALQELQKNSPNIPFIKSFTSASDFIKAKQAEQKQKVADLKKEIPSMVNDSLSRLMGKVS